MDIARQAIGLSAAFLTLGGSALAPATLAIAAPATGQDPTRFAAAADVQAQVAAMGQAMKPGQGFLWQPVVRDGATVAALEYWKKPGPPAVHPAEAEYTIVIAGAGSLVSGGTLVDARTTKPGLTEGSRIDGGTTRQLAPGDVILIPAGTPHWFGISGDRLVLLGIKIPGGSR